MFTFEVSKFEISNKFKFLQLLNIYPMVVTLEVLKFDKFNVVNFLWRNIPYILLTLEVSRWDKSNEIKLVQLQNIIGIDTTDEV